MTKRPEHVLFIVENNSVPRDRRVWAEARAVKEMGCEVSVICPRDNRTEQQPRSLEGIRIYAHPQPIEGHGKLGLILEYINAVFWELLLAVLIYLRHPFHAIHAANPPDLAFIVAMPFKMLGVRFVFDHHDICPENYLAKFGSRGILYRVLPVLERANFWLSDVVISTNETYRQIALTRGRKERDEVFVVRNGPELSRIPSVAPNSSLRAGFKFLVGYVGVIGQQEGLENLLAAVKYLVKDKKRHDIRFIIVGTGPHWKVLVEASKRMEIDEFLWFTGYVSDNCLYEILSSIDVAVNPEFRNDFTDRSTMIKIIEYMTFGKPIVQFYTHEGQISAGSAAVYVNENSPIALAEALVQLLEDPQKCRVKGKFGRFRIEKKLAWEHQKEELRRAYESLFDNRGSASRFPISHRSIASDRLLQR